MMKTIGLAHGNGGEENNHLIKNIFFKYFENDVLNQCEDAAIIEDGKLAFTTDSFTVSPLFFPGGDIGKLAVCGTCNDLAMMGAKPKYLTCSVIIEEGFQTDVLEKIVQSISLELSINGAMIVSGDTKVVPKGSVDKLFINTSGIGVIQHKGISAHLIAQGDAIVINRDIGCHGAAIFAAREGIEISSALKSDCASLYPQVQALLDAGIGISAMRDATRGGIAAVLNEWAEQSNVCIEIEEASLPISDEVKGVCEMLGFEATSLANEGTFVLAVKKEDAKKAQAILQQFDGCKMASVVGEVNQNYPKKVILKSPWGTSRYLETPSGELLPRIC